MSTESIKPIPCPRCGAEPTIEWSEYYKRVFHQQACRCRCQSVIVDDRLYQVPCGEMGPMAPTPEEATEAWNKQMKNRRVISCL